MQELGRVLIALGCLAVVLGAALLLAARLPWLGRLPGDIVVRRGPVTFYFPLLTCVVLSVVLTIGREPLLAPLRPAPGCRRPLFCPFSRQLGHRDAVLPSSP